MAPSTEKHDEFVRLLALSRDEELVVETDTIPAARSGGATMKERSRTATFTSGRALFLGLLLTLAACQSSEARSREIAEQSAREVDPPGICKLTKIQQCFTATHDECVQMAQAEIEPCIRATKRPTISDPSTELAWFQAVRICTEQRVTDALTRNGKGRPDCNASAK